MSYIIGGNYGALRPEGENTPMIIPTPYFPRNLESYAQWVSRFGLMAPYGKCQCGCGGDAPFSRYTNRKQAVTKGLPCRFINKHQHVNGTHGIALAKYLRPGDPGACWEWQGTRRKPYGYGNVKILGRTWLAHRVAWEYFFGPIDDGIFVCHRCDNPSCCNPMHLFLGCAKDNNSDRDGKGRNAHGERNGSSKLSDSDIPTIRALSSQGISNCEIARRYGLHNSSIRMIVIGANWSHVK